MTTLTKEQQQEILKGLFKSAIEKNTEEFKNKLRDAKKADFDFFNTRLSEDYEVNDMTVDQGASLIEDMRIMNEHYPKELIEVFLKQGIITRDSVKKLYDHISGQNDLTQLNLNFIKLSLDHIKNESIQIDQSIFKKICSAVTNTMNSSFSRYGPRQHSEIKENIFKIEEVVKSLVPLLEEDEKEKFKNAFYTLKNNVEAKFNITTSTTPQPTTISDPQNNSSGISPRGWTMIAAGATVGCIGFIWVSTKVISTIATPTDKIAMTVLAGVVGAIVGAAIGLGIDLAIECCFTDAVASKCSSKQK